MPQLFDRAGDGRGLAIPSDEDAGWQMSLMRIVLEYDIAYGESMKELADSVNKLISIQSANWEPHGAPIKIGELGDGFYAQAMVRVDYVTGGL